MYFSLKNSPKFFKNCLQIMKSSKRIGLGVEQKSPSKRNRNNRPHNGCYSDSQIPNVFATSSRCDET